MIILHFSCVFRRIVVLFVLLVCLPLLSVSVRGQQASSSLHMGDWAKYSLEVTWHSNIPGTTEPPVYLDTSNIEWVKGEIAAIQSANVTVDLTTHFKNGTEIVVALMGDLETGDGNLSSLPYPLLFVPVVVKSDLKVGDFIPGLFANVTKRISQVYAGYRRDINCHEYVFSTVVSSMGMYYYYDKSTGFLCKAETNTSTSTMGYEMSYSTSVTIIDTNKFTDQTHNINIENVVLSPTSVYVGNHVGVNVSVENDGNEAETFVIAANYYSTEAGRGNSTEIGRQQIDNLTVGGSIIVCFEWNVSGLSAGTYNLEAVSYLQGDVNLGNSTFTLESLTVQNTPPAGQPLLLYAAVGIVAVLVLVLYVRRNRKASKGAQNQSATPTT